MHLVPQVYGLSPEAVGYRHFLFYGPILLKFQLLEAIIVDLSTVIAFLPLVLLDLDKDTLKTAEKVFRLHVLLRTPGHSCERLTQFT